MTGGGEVTGQIDNLNIQVYSGRVCELGVYKNRPLS
jgi:hypothetical protein